MDSSKMLVHMMWYWQLLLVHFLLLHIGGKTDALKAATAEVANGGVNANVNAPSTDTFSIRHGRSKVRHSNEKDHFMRGMRATTTARAGELLSTRSTDGGNGSTAALAYGPRGDGGGIAGIGAYDNEISASGNVTIAVSGTSRLSAFASGRGSSSSIQSGNGYLFGSDYWQNSDANGSLINHQARSQANPLQTVRAAKKSKTKATVKLHLQSEPLPLPLPARHHAIGFLVTEVPDAGSTLPPVTHRIRKLHMKKIMESIRNSVDKSLGVKLSKNHRSLVEAEQLQGRPTDVSEENIDEDDDNYENDVSISYGGKAADVQTATESTDGRIGGAGGLDEVLQLADELDLPSNSLEDSYQNDEYITTTPTTALASTKSGDSLEIGDEMATFVPPAASAVANSEELPMRADAALELSVVTPRSTALSAYEMLPSLSGKATKRGPQPLTTKNKPELLDALDNADLHALSGNALLLLSNEANKSDESKLVEDFSAGSSQLANELENAAIVNNGISSFEYMQNLTDEMHDEEVNNTLLGSSNELDVKTVSLYASESPAAAKTTVDETPWATNSYAEGPNQLASTSVGGIGLERQSMELEEINFDDMSMDNVQEGGIMDDGHIDNQNPNGFPLSGTGDNGDGVFSISGGDGATSGESDEQANPFLAGVVDAANEDQIYWDEISRNNRRNLMRGRDVVTKFLQIVETQHSLGSNCEAGTSLNLGEGVVDRYAQDRFRVEAEVAVNRANMLTRIFKMTGAAVQADVNLLHASVLSMVEFDDDIFAAGNCFDWNEHPAQPGLFCPFAYRLPPPNLGAVLAKDLATEYHYLGNTSEWFFQARKNAEKVIARNEQYLKSFHLYSNKTDERIEDDTLAVKYEDGRWSKPYYDCGGGNIWMLTYTVPFFGYENGTYHFKGTSGIDIDLRRVDIDQCPQRNTPGTTQPLNIFAGTDKCKQRTTMCEALKGLGFRRGSYKCVCRKGYYFPDTTSTQKFFNGSLLEEEYEKLMLGKNSTYNIVNEYECLPCAEGCESCVDGSPCIAALNWPMRTSILVLACTVIGLLPPAAWFTFRYQQVKVVRAASPALLRVIALGAFFIYCTNIVMYPNPNLYTCTARIWLREIGFSLTYGALMLKTWRISVIFRVRSAKAVKITDAALLKRLGIICGVIGTCLLVRTLVSPPDVVVGRTADDLKAFLCKTDYWDYTFTSMEVLFLAWGVRLCIMVRKAPSEFNESRFISMAIYNEFLLTCFLNVSMLFLQSPANPDLLYIIFFCHTQLTVTLLLCLIFGSKVYIVLRSGKSHQENIGLGAKASGAKFNFRPQVRTFANPSSVTTSTVPVMGTTSAETKLSEQEALEEIRQLGLQLKRLQEIAPPRSFALTTISNLLDGLKVPSDMMMVSAPPTQIAHAAGTNQLHPNQSDGALPLLSLSTEMQKYSQKLHVPQNNNIPPSSGRPQQRQVTTFEVETSTTTIEEAPVRCEERAMNTDLTSAEDFHQQALGCSQGHIICSRCLVISKEHYFSCRPFTPPTTCQQLGSPHAEGSISFANIKLECMCSQPDDLDIEVPVQQRRRTNVRSAATNTPPPSSDSTRRRMRSKTLGSSSPPDNGGIRYRICDNCKIKYRSNKTGGSGAGGRKIRKSSKYRSSVRAATEKSAKLMGPSTSGLSQTRSHDVLDRRLPTATTSSHASAEAGTKKMHSTDDIIFYTTTDDDDSSDDTVDDDDDGILRRQKIICRSTTSFEAAVVSCSGATVSVEGGESAPTTVTATGEGEEKKGEDEGAAAAVEGGTQSVGNISQTSNNSNSAENSQNSNNENNTTKPNGNGRSKRPDKLLLDLNDRSKYTKEVSV